MHSRFIFLFFSTIISINAQESNQTVEKPTTIVEAIKNINNKEKIILEDGSEHTTDFFLGSPVLQSKNGFKIIKISPEVERAPRPLKFDLFWHFIIEYKTQLIKNIVITPLMDRDNFIIIPMSERESDKPNSMPYTKIDTKIYRMDKFKKLWHNYGTNSSFTTGFDVQFNFWDSNKESVKISQFVKLFSKVIDKSIYEYKKSNAELDKERRVEEIKLNNGESFKIPTIYKQIELQSNDCFTIDRLTPVLVNDQENKNKPHLRWALEITLHQPGEYEILFSSYEYKQIIETGLVKGPTRLKMNSFPSNSAPQIWDWIKTQGDTLIPFCVKFKKISDNTTTNTIQWIKIPSESKKKIVEILNKSNI